ncbi:tetratricopeptide repeat protein [Marinobacterium sp. LSUCC0821]|uniref:tetratricopeptide repeat protein n=1 Tax=Marinobacterium sp. LSUCC0821 TaxID=2668067 RepID=UPI0014516B73|nr:sel1 repeat family protein [Marinobacterium sp. LSUCC0821]QJD70837.1 sel1 repeat family protein [Marinobacterium sp. LSUCC0821]
MSLIGNLAAWSAYAIFRSPLARRSKWVHDKTMKLFRVGAQRGSVKALSTYGFLLHFRGSDLASKEQGALYIQAAAERGDARSQYQMGKLYEGGYPPVIFKIADKAFDNYKAAAEQGHPVAIQRMVDIYSQGELGREVDVEKAQKWEMKLG